MTLLLAAIMCTIMLSPGTHTLECTAEYVHTLPDGTRYYDSTTRGVIIPGGWTAECSGEGHPFKVVMKDLGMIVCHNETPLFADGFESGDTGEWG